MKEQWVRAGLLADFANNRLIYKEGNYHIALFQIENTIYAVDNICTHGNACLSEGELEGLYIECPLHAGLVDLRNGKAADAPITRDTRVYQTRTVDGIVEMNLLVAAL